jgi:hypothetical protein
MSRNSHEPMYKIPKWFVIETFGRLRDHRDQMIRLWTSNQSPDDPSKAKDCTLTLIRSLHTPLYKWDWYKEECHVEFLEEEERDRMVKKPLSSSWYKVSV